jgi:hypothetical protein
MTKRKPPEEHKPRGGVRPGAGRPKPPLPSEPWGPIRMPGDLLVAIEEYRAARGTTRTAAVVELLRAGLMALWRGGGGG